MSERERAIMLCIIDHNFNLLYHQERYASQIGANMLTHLHRQPATTEELAKALGDLEKLVREAGGAD